ncbi:MAG: lytic murein transglycosylase, partial [Pseudomonadota bacterium]
MRILRNAIIAASFFSLALATTLHAETFEDWQHTMAKRARAEGIKKKTIRNYLFTTKENDAVIALDRKQPEGTLGYAEYRKIATSGKIVRGRAMLQKHRKLLNIIGNKYGVDPEVIVALWGMETDYGRNCGNISTLDALATLAYEGRRSEFFSGELLILLKLIDNGEIDPKNLHGSWAGAMGQTQFMPSSFLKYAVDYNKDRHKDIWHNESDIFASIANYLKTEGWEKGAISMTDVTTPENFDRALADLNISKKIAEWKELGV